MSQDNLLQGVGLAVVATIFAGILFAFLSIEPIIEKNHLVKEDKLQAEVASLRHGLESEISNLEVKIEERFREAYEKLESQSQNLRDENRRTFEGLRTELQSVAQAMPFLGTNMYFKYYEETAEDSVLVRFKARKKSIALITTYASGSVDGQAKPVSLSVEISVDGEMCAKSQDTLDNKKDVTNLFVSSTCIKDLVPRGEVYKIAGAATGENIDDHRMRLRYVILEEVLGEKSEDASAL